MARRETGFTTPALVDSTGAGDPIVDALQKGSSNFEGFKFTSLSKQRIMEGLAVSVQGHAIRFPPAETKPLPGSPAHLRRSSKNLNTNILKWG